MSAGSEIPGEVIPAEGVVETLPGAPRRELGPEGGLTATEQLLLGRAGEEPGRWTGMTSVERDGRPMMHTTVGLGRGAQAWLPPVAPRAYATTVHLGTGDGNAATVRVPA